MIRAVSGSTTCGTRSRRFWCAARPDPKTVQALLRHSDVRTTLQLYAHSVTADRLAAQELALQAILGSGNALAGPPNC